MISGPAFSHARSRTHRGGTLGVPAYEMSPLIATATTRTRRRKVPVEKISSLAPLVRYVVISRFKRAAIHMKETSMTTPLAVALLAVSKCDDRLNVAPNILRPPENTMTQYR